MNLDEKQDQRPPRDTRDEEYDLLLARVEELEAKCLEWQERYDSRKNSHDETLKRVRELDKDCDALAARYTSRKGQVAELEQARRREREDALKRLEALAEENARLREALWEVLGEWKVRECNDPECRVCARRITLEKKARAALAEPSEEDGDGLH